jgi:hypothetical protein
MSNYIDLFIILNNTNYNIIPESDLQITILNNQDTLNILNKYDYNKIVLNKKTQPDTESPEDESLQYNKTWLKLDKFQKINRLIQFINTMNLTKEEKLDLKILIVENINEKKLTKKTEIIYDETLGIVKEIINLKKNNCNKFYINKDITQLDVVKTEVINKNSISSFKKLDIKNLLNKFHG